ncbi:hypothetical protein ACHAW6_011973 [Cyclotella cf. meneghiniana]
MNDPSHTHSDAPPRSSISIPCGYVCTHAVTGSHHPAHQSIYACLTCLERTNERPDAPACVCECCAETCHDRLGHRISFVGVGPCTCDCSRMGDGDCVLRDASRAEAARLGFRGDESTRRWNEPMPRTIPPVPTLISAKDGDDDDVGERDGSGEWMGSICIECNSGMGGYTVDAFHIPSLSAVADEAGDNVERCQRLIRQAEALVELSRDTFWMPVDDRVDESSPSAAAGWSDLEILAKEIYRRHVRAYDLQSSRISSDESAQDDDASQPGAEWWVQVKPAGSCRAPVDLHYDKDEALAEAFCLGSFPTLSTVTYLTGSNTIQGQNAAPTVVFPHTYHDDEDAPISAMLVSHPVQGKHIVFDGRLLHGAPGHPALRRGHDAKTQGDSSLRVTFLVNIWRTGRPAGVRVLPQSIRTVIQSASAKADTTRGRLSDVLPLNFEKTNIPQYFAPSKLSLAFAAAENPMDPQIILPFVSKGATWISDDEAEEKHDIRQEYNQEDDNERAGHAKGSTDRNDSDSVIDDDDGEEEEDELFLQIPQFVTPRYVRDGADTAIFLFQEGNEARLVRRSGGKTMDAMAA